MVELHEIGIASLEDDETDRIAEGISRLLFPELREAAPVIQEISKDEILASMTNFQEFEIVNIELLAKDSRITIFAPPVLANRIPTLCRIVGLVNSVAFQAVGTLEKDPICEHQLNALISTISLFPRVEHESLLEKAGQDTAADIVTNAIRYAFTEYHASPEAMISNANKSLKSIPEIKSFLDAKKIADIVDQESMKAVEPMVTRRARVRM